MLTFTFAKSEHGWTIEPGDRLNCAMSLAVRGSVGDEHMWKTLAAVSVLCFLSACGAPHSPQAPAPQPPPAESVVQPGGSVPSRIDLSDCPEECSGHDAGYAWAQSQRIESYRQCRGSDAGFLEGCATYVHDRHEEQEYEEEQSYQSPTPPR